MHILTFSIRTLLAATISISLVSDIFSADTVIVDVNLDVQHILGADTMFDRSKFVVIHADVTEQEWDGDNAIADLRNDFLNGYNVYMGRNTGGITWNLENQISEDPSRNGYANPSDISSTGNTTKSNYASNTHYHPYEYRNDQVLCMQLHPFWPDGELINNNWAFSQADSPSEPFGTATGEYYGRYIRDHYGTGSTTGKPKPTLIEIINEPVWHLVDFGNETPLKIFDFHNIIAGQIRKYNPDDNLQIGGYCTAFPDFDVSNFQRWEERWKLFMDIAGDSMDFWSIHLYDFPSINNGKQLYRKGSNMEATLDMMEQYSFIKFGVAKPFLVSEFGAQMHDYFGEWSSYRDWLHLKSVNSMMLQFMERANLITKVINFLPIKATWGTNAVDDTYNHRLMRMANEPVSLTGQWTYTDMVKTYQLWSDVEGKRVDSKPNSPDVLSDAFIDGDTAYFIINNLKFKPVLINVDLQGSNNVISKVESKQLYLKSNLPVLEGIEYNYLPSYITLEPEGTIILKCAFSDSILIDESSEEKKHYATTYLQGITANTPKTFTIQNVDIGTYGEAVLRIGIGRDHGKSLTPVVKFNGDSVRVPTNFRGDNQEDRDNFFGVLEIPIPYSYLSSSNSVSVEFPDDGGYISTVTLQTFKQSREITRAEYNYVGIKSTLLKEENISIVPNPANSYFSIEGLSDTDYLHVTLYSLSGSTVLNRTIYSSNEQINIEHLPRGIYIVNVKANKSEYNSKLIIQ